MLRSYRGVMSHQSLITDCMWQFHLYFARVSMHGVFCYKYALVQTIFSLTHETFKILWCLFYFSVGLKMLVVMFSTEHDICSRPKWVLDKTLCTMIYVFIHMGVFFDAHNYLLIYFPFVTLYGSSQTLQDLDLDLNLIWIWYILCFSHEKLLCRDGVLVMAQCIM